ncbi:MAG: rhodanese-like domain-containing protein [candidate division KSB1 bacterium]|nr:rhodanese-like domain-containing protein [candidate division KSB1 bacterium]
MSMIKITAILALSVLLGFISNSINPNGISLFEQEQKEFKFDAPPAQPVSVSRSDLKQMIQKDACLILDARLPDAYNDAHIPGAVNIPFERLGMVYDKIQTLPKEKWLITYCDSPECDLGELLADELYNLGYEYVGYYKSGIEEWKQTEQVAHE